MSIKETNKVRASLGLKPLRDSSKAESQKKDEEQAHQDRVETKKKAEQAELLAARVADAKERRRQERTLKRTKALGEADPEADDVAAWVLKSRKEEEKRKAKEREAALRTARRLEEQDEDAEESDEDDGPYNAKSLAGMKVKHSADELDTGETMILTLEDRGILDESGRLVEDEDVLVESLTAEEKKKLRAKKAAEKKSAPLYGEEGKKRAILDKYDEGEDDEEGIQLGEDGSVDPEKLRRQREIRAKLEAQISGTEETATVESVPGQDYYTSEEMAALFKPKKKKKKKEKRLRTKDTSEVLAALEAEAAARGAGSDLGNRSARPDREEASRKDELEKAAKKASAYEAALDKANKASEVLRPSAPDAPPAAEEDEDEADRELQESLARARRLSQRKAPSGSDVQQLAQEIVKSRSENPAEPSSAQDGDVEGIQFTEATEFCRNIGVDERGVKDEDGDVKMELADGDAEADGGGDPAAKVKDEDTAGESKEGVAAGAGAGVFTGNNLGKGIFGALDFLRSSGDLRSKREWSGRTNDMKAVNLQGISDLFDNDEDNRLNTSIEAALIRRDEFGRVLTPKEAFRMDSYAFHGKPPSKNKQEKRLRKYQEQLAVKKMEAGDTPLQSANRLREAQNTTAQPYLVLTGRGATSESSLKAAMKKNEAAGLTPMLGDRKVETMLGLKRPPKGPGTK